MRHYKTRFYPTEWRLQELEILEVVSLNSSLKFSMVVKPLLKEDEC